MNIILNEKTNKENTKLEVNDILEVEWFDGEIDYYLAVHHDDKYCCVLLGNADMNFNSNCTELDDILDDILIDTHNTIKSYRILKSDKYDLIIQPKSKQL